MACLVTHPSMHTFVHLYYPLISLSIHSFIHLPIYPFCSLSYICKFAKFDGLLIYSAQPSIQWTIIYKVLFAIYPSHHLNTPSFTHSSLFHLFIHQSICCFHHLSLSICWFDQSLTNPPIHLITHSFTIHPYCIHLFIARLICWLDRSLIHQPIHPSLHLSQTRWSFIYDHLWYPAVAFVQGYSKL